MPTIIVKAALLFLLLCGMANAAETCAPRTWYWPTSGATAEVKVKEAAGEWSYWWCQRPDRTWYLVTWAQVSGYGTPEMRAKVEDVIRSASSPDAGVTLAFETLSQIPAPGSAARATFDQLHYKACVAGDANAPTRPASGTCKPPTTTAPTLVVGPATSADGTRPAYRFAAQVQGARVTPWATAGQPCDASKAFKTTAAGIWAPFGPAFAPDIGTLCVKP